MGESALRRLLWSRGEGFAALGDPAVHAGAWLGVGQGRLGGRGRPRMAHQHPLLPDSRLVDAEVHVDHDAAREPERDCR